jgi:hypothetical protein
MRPLRLTQLFALAAAFAATVLPADAGQRKFAYTYEATTAPKGSIEFENWVTWKRRSIDGDRQNVFDFRHELEFGVTDRLQLGFYLADWTYNDSDSRKHATYKHSGVEAIYNLTNPTTDFLGSALYLEALVGNDVFELEGKLLLQKNFGPVIVAYNAVLEAEWEGEDLDERTGEFAQTFGVSVELNRSVSAGAELVHEVEFPDWRNEGESMLFAGPNVSVRWGRAFATATCLFQITDVDGEPDVQTRLIFGFDF